MYLYPQRECPFLYSHCKHCVVNGIGNKTRCQLISSALTHRTGSFVSHCTATENSRRWGGPLESSSAAAWLIPTGTVFHVEPQMWRQGRTRGRRMENGNWANALQKRRRWDSITSNERMSPFFSWYVFKKWGYWWFLPHKGLWLQWSAVKITR